MFRLFILLFVGFLTRPALQAQEQPNVLFIFADDQAYDTVHALGNEEISTPNLDRLVEQGTTFTHAYNQGGWHGAVCVASRTMLNTGLSLWRAEQAEPDLKEQWVPEQRLWPQLMSAAGYQTFFTGKWHVKADAEKIFDVVRHVRGGMPAQTDAGYDRPKSRTDDTWQPWDKERGGFWKGGTHWSEVVGNDGADYLTMAADDERPFFMYLAFNAPHDPRQSPKEFVDLYPAEKIQVPADFLPEYPYEIGSNRIRDEKLAPFPRTDYSVQVNRREYYAIITHMDEQIGRILSALESSDQPDNTWIVFTADHGLSCGHHGLLGKQNMYDHSMRVPFVVCGPGVTAGATIDTPIYLQDVMPTTLAIAGATIPDHVEFDNLLPLLSEAGSGVAEPAGMTYGAYTQTQRMITDGSWKLILYPKIRTSLLFDLASDPHEIHDLSNRDGSQEVKRRLFQQLLQEQKRLGDPLDLTASFKELAKE